MSGITEQEYAAWLEKALQALYKSKPLAKEAAQCGDANGRGNG